MTVKLTSASHIALGAILSIMGHEVSVGGTEFLDLSLTLADLRHANLHPGSPSAIKTPTRPTASSQPGTPLSPSMSPTIVVRPRPSTQEFYTPPRAGATAVPGPEHATSSDPDTPITRPNFRDPRPISVPFAGGAKALDERGLLRRAESPRSKVGDVVRTGEECQGCGKRVYAAEVVHAIGHKCVFSGEAGRED